MRERGASLPPVDAPPVLPAPPLSPLDTLEDVLAHTDRPLTLVQLRQACRIRTAHVCQALAALTAQGRVQKTAAGYQRTLIGAVSRDPFPAAP